jgi:hypothetical protein
MGISEFSFSY